jgi:hypothetical protein
LFEELCKPRFGQRAYIIANGPRFLKPSPRNLNAKVQIRR